MRRDRERYIYIERERESNVDIERHTDGDRVAEIMT